MIMSKEMLFMSLGWGNYKLFVHWSDLAKRAWDYFSSPNRPSKFEWAVKLIADLWCGPQLPLSGGALASICSTFGWRINRIFNNNTVLVSFCSISDFISSWITLQLWWRKNSSSKTWHRDHRCRMELDHLVPRRGTYRNRTKQPEDPCMGCPCTQTCGDIQLGGPNSFLFLLFFFFLNFVYYLSPLLSGRLHICIRVFL